MFTQINSNTKSLLVLVSAISKSYLLSFNLILASFSTTALSEVSLCELSTLVVIDRITARNVGAMLSESQRQDLERHIEAFRHYNTEITRGAKLEKYEFEEFSHAAAVYGAAEYLASLIKDQNSWREFIIDAGTRREAVISIQEMREKIALATQKLLKALTEFREPANGPDREIKIAGMLDQERVLKSLEPYGSVVKNNAIKIFHDISERKDPGVTKVGFAHQYRFYHFSGPGGSYRICIEVLENREPNPPVFIVHSVGPHENFYKSLRRLRGS